MTESSTAATFAICLRNEGYSASLEPRKVYQLIPDAAAEALDHVRVIDESGEDYLYPRGFFVAIQLPRRVVDAIRAAS